MSGDSAEVAVVGAGIVGAAVAFHLAQTGMKVTVIEAEAPAAGATGSSGGFIRIHHPQWELTQLAHSAYEEFTQWGKAVGGSNGFMRTGLIYSAPADQLQQRIKGLQGLGVRCQVANTSELRRHYPQLKWPDGAATLLEPGAGYADPRRCVKGYLDRVVQMGGRVMTATVTGPRSRNGGLSGLDTSSGFLNTETAVIAAGVKTRAVMPVALPVRTKRIVAQRVSASSEFTGLPAYIDETGGLWFRPDGPKQILVGADSDEWDLDPDEPLPPINKSFLKEIRTHLQGMFTDRDVSNLLDIHNGLDAYTADRLPIIDELPLFKGLYLATGFSGGGFKTAPAVGRLLASWIRTGKKDALLEPFRLNREAEWPQVIELRQVEKVEVPAGIAAMASGETSAPLVTPAFIAQTTDRGKAAPSQTVASGNGERAAAAETTTTITLPNGETPPKKKKRKRKKKRPGEPTAAVEPSAPPAPSPEQAPPASGLKIRSATESDLPILAELIMAYIDFYQHPRPHPKAIEALLRHLQIDPGAGRQFVALSGEQPAGFATLYFTYSTLRAQKIAVLNDLYVKPDSRKQGIGKALFDHCRSFAEKSGYPHMEWVTSSDNVPAQALYQKVGAQKGNWIVYNL
jgi:glycine/D-amino acid oxidase-like deaminating enzyme/ribosomal protein S18 acetylase RimI-like enzyme